MKPTIKQINALQAQMAKAYNDSPLKYADIAKLADVDASQVGRICKGDFKTFSNNLIQICRVLKVKVPRIEPDKELDTEWAKAQASMKRLYTRKPEGAVLIRRVLDAIADLQAGAAEPSRSVEQ